jgi:hypothetical protein
MPREHYALLPIPAATSARARRHAHPLPWLAAIFWIVVLSLGAWSMIVAVTLAVV